MTGQQQSQVRRLNRHWQSGSGGGIILHSGKFSATSDYGEFATSMTITRNPTTGAITVRSDIGDIPNTLLWENPDTAARIRSANVGRTVRWIINFTMPPRTTYQWVVPQVKVKTDIGIKGTNISYGTAILDTDPNIVPYTIEIYNGSIGTYNFYPKSNQIILDYKVTQNDNSQSVYSTLPFEMFAYTINPRNEYYTVIPYNDLVTALGDNNYYSWLQYSNINGEVQIIR